MLTGCLGISRNARSIENKFTWARSCLLGKLPDRDHRSFLGDPVVGQIENLGSSVEGLHLRSIQGFWGYAGLQVRARFGRTWRSTKHRNKLYCEPLLPALQPLQSYEIKYTVLQALQNHAVSALCLGPLTFIAIKLIGFGVKCLVCLTFRVYRVCVHRHLHVLNQLYIGVYTYT